MRVRATAVAVGCSVVLAGCTAPASAPNGVEAPPTQPPVSTVTTIRPRPDAPGTVTTTGLDGNRVSPGTVDLDLPPVVLAVDFVPTALVAAPVTGGHLLVATDDSSAVAAWIIDETGVATAPAQLVRALGVPGGGRPTLLRADDGWRFAPARSALGDSRWQLDGTEVRAADGIVTAGAAVVEDALADARFALADDLLVVPVAPTDAYRHGVLGDEIEAGALALADTSTGAVEAMALPDDAVLEGLGAILADVDGDGIADPVVTVSRPDVGAAQAVVLDGALVLGPAIGTGNRWRHLLGVADGRLFEIVTPHLAQVFQVLELRDGRLEVVVSVPSTIASHRIGSRDLELAALVDADGDGGVDVLGPAAEDRGVLRVLDGDTGATITDLLLPGDQTSNLVTMHGGARRTVAALGTDDGVVVLLGVQQ